MHLAFYLNKSMYMAQNSVNGPPSSRNKWGMEFFSAQSGIFLSSSNQSINSTWAENILTDYTEKAPQNIGE